MIITEKYYQWLCLKKGEVKCGTEGFICADQKQALKNISLKYGIDKTQLRLHAQIQPKINIEKA